MPAEVPSGFHTAVPTEISPEFASWISSRVSSNRYVSDKLFVFFSTPCFFNGRWIRTVHFIKRTTLQGYKKKTRSSNLSSLG